MNGVLYRRWEEEADTSDFALKQLVVPQSLTSVVMQKLHNGPAGSNLGFNKTLSKIWWVEFDVTVGELEDDDPVTEAQLTQAAIAVATVLLYKSLARPGAVCNARLKEFEAAVKVRQEKGAMCTQWASHRPQQYPAIPPRVTRTSSNNSRAVYNGRGALQVWIPL